MSEALVPHDGFSEGMILRKQGRMLPPVQDICPLKSSSNSETAGLVQKRSEEFVRGPERETASTIFELLRELFSLDYLDNLVQSLFQFTDTEWSGGVRLHSSPPVVVDDDEG